MTNEPAWEALASWVAIQPPQYARATTEAVERAEMDIGCELPPLLRRGFLEIANGGFGPTDTPGVLGVYGGNAPWGKTLSEAYLEFKAPVDRAILSADALDLADWTWPDRLVELVDRGDGCGWYLDCSTQEVFYADIDFMDGARTFSDWMRPEAPTLAEWILRWTNGDNVVRAKQQ